MARRTDASKQRRWLELICLWQQSQLSVRAFCNRHRLSEPSFYAWRRLLQQRGLIPARPVEQRAKSAPAFVKLSLAAEPHVSVPIELVLRQGHLLRVHPGFDADTIRQLLRLLEEPAC
jgi:transposase-like protein